MQREPRAPGPDASELEYKRYLAEHQRWQQERGKAKAPPPIAAAFIPAIERLEGEPEWATDWLPAPARDFVEAMHRSYAVPRVMGVAAVMCAAATLAQGKVRVRIKDGWEEPLSLFWLVFSGTASMKSTVLAHAVAPVRAIQAKLEQDMAPLAAQAKLKRRTKEAKIKAVLAKMPAESAQNAATENPFQPAYRDTAFGRAQLLANLQQELDEIVVPSAPRWLYDDVNPPLVLTLMRQNQEAEGLARFAVLDAEGTFVANFLGRHTGHTDVTSLLKGYTGEAIDRARASRSGDDPVKTHLEAPALTMCLLVQPHILDELRATKELSENGLMGRCIVSVLGADNMPGKDAPAVPRAILEAYSAWLWAIHAAPAGTVIDLSEFWEDTLGELYEHVVGQVMLSRGGVGWLRRTVGRVARVAALALLTGQLSEGSDCRAGVRGGTGARGEKVKNIILSLSQSLYFRGLSTARANEPNSTHTTRLCLRTLTWLRQSKTLTVGSEVTVRELMRGLTLSRSQVDDICEYMLESRRFEAKQVMKHRNRTTTITYRILNLDPEGTERPKPEAVPDLEPDIDELEPEEAELESEEL